MHLGDHTHVIIHGIRVGRRIDGGVLPVPFFPGLRNTVRGRGARGRVVVFGWEISAVPLSEVLNSSLLVEACRFGSITFLAFEGQRQEKKARGNTNLRGSGVWHGSDSSDDFVGKFHLATGTSSMPPVILLAWAPWGALGQGVSPSGHSCGWVALMAFTCSTSQSGGFRFSSNP